MPPKRQSRDIRMESQQPFAVWKEKPAGPEQVELDRMINAKEIDMFDTAESVRSSCDLFKKFSPNVFSAHFRKTKGRLGLSANVAVHNQNDAHSSTIPELGAIKSIQAQSLPNFEERVPIEFKNAPYWAWVYTDHDKKKDCVCVALPIISGSKDIKFTLSEDGCAVTIHYNWASPMYKAAQLFEKAKIGTRKISMDHPKIHSFVSHLLQAGVTENSKPPGEIIIELPLKVQREIGTYSKETFTVNGTNLILLEFSAYQKSLIIEDADNSLVFE